MLLAGALTTGLIVLSGGYGPHRDELYFVSAGHRPAWGYPDQPPLTPLVARLADEIDPGSLVVLRLTSALAMGLLVVLAALTARELGGARVAQLLTAVATATAVVTAVLGHLLSTASLDVLCWTAVVLLAIRTLVRNAPRGWLAVGLVAGIGLEDKHLVAFLLLGLAVGVAVTPPVRHHLRSTWAWAGAAVAALLWLPNLAWQATNGWPQLELAGDIREEYLTAGERIAYLLLLVVIMSPLTTALWGLGLIWLLRSRDRAAAAARPVAWAFVVLFVVFFLTGGKAYYLAGLLPALVAAGTVWLERRWSARQLVLTGAAVALAGLVAWPSAVPVLPERAFADSVYAVIGEDQAETIGWPRFVSAVRRAVADRGEAYVVTQNYGEAGALEWYDVGVPVYSGHNGFGAWGPPPDGARSFVLVGYEVAPRGVGGCRIVNRVDNSLDLDNEEQGAPVSVCDTPPAGWAAVWPQVRHLDG